MAKKKNKSTTPEYKVGDYVRIFDKEAIADLDLYDCPEELYGIITEVYRAIFVRNSTYAEYQINIQGYSNMSDICFYPEQFEKVH